MNDIENNRVKAETALIEQIKARIAFHANEHRQTYEVGKGVMDYLARDLLADFRAAGGALLPVKPNGTVYVIHRRRVMERDKDFRRRIKRAMTTQHINLATYVNSLEWEAGL